MKQQIFNLIILDESGSMDCVCQQTISGCNETINTIQSAQKRFAETQEHFVSIYAFQSNGDRPSRYLIKNLPALEVKHVTSDDYEPCGCTPLNDAVGSTLADLKTKVSRSEGAIGSVTIITDGAENSSTDFTAERVAQMIAELKEQGWNFCFIGANIDVVKTAHSYNIDNSLEFKQDDAGTRHMFERERRSRMKYYERVENCCSCPMEAPERAALMRDASANYFEEEPELKSSGRIAPDVIKHLKPGEIFVFGSNLQGMHGGGAARAAVQHFGAVMGQGEGLQGHSYAIPTMQGGADTIAPYVERFILFAKQHPELTFLVTRIGCGFASFVDAQIAPLFKNAVGVHNIHLPQSFWDVLNES